MADCWGPTAPGKSTLIRSIMGIVEPDAGRIRPRWPARGPAERRCSSIGYLPEERGLYKDMRVGEQAVYFRPAQGHGARPKP